MADPVPSVLNAHPRGVTLALKAMPNAARTEPAGFHGDALRLRVKAPPVEGKANDAIRAWAADRFGVRPAAISFLKGEHSSLKVILIEGLTLPSAQNLLDP